ncbi:MAG: hypothetical protein GZ094_20975 [Mariniphaga sp.]|nr:hypothetical protein [Mariniphaga sp.]
MTPIIGFSQTTRRSRMIIKAENRLKNMDNPLPEWSHVGRIRFDSLSFLSEKQLVQVFFTSSLSYTPVRENKVAHIENSVREVLGRKFKNYPIEIYTDHHLLKELVPNSLRTAIPIDQNRISGDKSNRIPVVQQSGKEKSLSGLYNNNIALWDSHGWYYESKLDRWEWQRARLFGTVEDMYTMSYVLPYIVPMLENSGANVFLPRERDWQSQEVIVDNDKPTPDSELIISDGIAVEQIVKGFIKNDTLFSGDNPFQMGTSLRFQNLKDNNQLIKYIPSFSEKGRYSVSVSYQSDDASLTEVKYTVYHAGGITEFLVNQKIGGGTWIYLGTFDFLVGKNPEMGMVTISCTSEKPGFISADAVKFGGGMGNVARRPPEESVQNKKSLAEKNTKTESVKNNPQLFDYKLSGKPGYLEGARYYLQSAGFPDTLTYNLNKNSNDYNDDYQSRGKWVNYLMGNPNISANEGDLTGMQIPIDLAFAFHTDAGVTPNDSIIGTLGIYSTTANQGLFPNGKSRLASRDLTDLIQTQVVDDIRQIYNPQWTRRGLWDKQYSEALRPNVPTMLLELFSHQNIADMKFGLDPRFRFDVSRAIYKGMLKFQSYQENRPFIVQPLPVNDFAITKTGDNSFKLSWSAVNDPLEPSARPDKYKVYQRIDGKGFDNGVIVDDTTLVLKLDQYDQIYSFKVTALNKGGESFPGETLSVGQKSNSKGNILVVNGFDRICGPAIFDNGITAGVAWWKDQGVADRQDISFVGFQYDFDRKSAWLDDDSPGWGASYGDMEGKVIPGNSFDYPFIHGKAIMAAGYSFVSISDEVFSESKFDISSYFATDIILGEERSTRSLKDTMLIDYKIYTPGMISKLSELTENGSKLFISGAYIGSEFGESKDSITANFAKDVLHFTWRTGHASKGGSFYTTDYARRWLNGKWNFNVEYHPEIYTVEAPDGIEPAGKNAITAFRYGENNVSAGVLFNGKYKIVAMGLPFEAITDSTDRVILMQQIIHFFESK